MSEGTEWKRPSQIMKSHRRRKSVTQKRITQDASERTSIIYKSPSKPVKRINPFGQNRDTENSSKRQKLEKNDDDKPPSCQLFSVLDNVIKDGPAKVLSVSSSEVTKKSPKDNCKNDNTFGDTFKKDIAQSERYLPPKKETTLSSTIPIDWSLKTKLRVVSSRPLNWCSKLKSAEEASGVTSFVKDSPYQVGGLSEQQKLFQRCCMYWAHPNVPWMRTYPRIFDDSKAGINFSYLLQEEVQRCLQADWEQSFTSAYHQLRSGLCPYFYLCTHNFTVLFHQGPGGNQSSMVALVTPTTRGFRESLETEGISFRLPVGNKPTSPERPVSAKVEKQCEESTDSNKEQEDRSEDVDEDADDLLTTDDAASGWLESMGLNKKEFPSLDPKRVKLQREGFRLIDHRPESLVCIEGGEVQAFYNFLLSCRTCTPASGSQAGLPPTILSPTPFQGGTLKSQKVKHTAVKQCDRDGHVSHAHIVEMSGPIMPHNCQTLVSLYHHTQEADFGMVFNNHDPTVPFNVLPQVSQTVPNNSYHSNHGSADTCGSASPAGSDLADKIGTGSSQGSEGCDIKERTQNNDLIQSPVMKGQLRDTSMLDVNTHFKHQQIEEDRICAIKELVSTKDGFTWTT